MIDAHRGALAGVADWWPEFRAKMADETGKIRAFFQAATEFQAVASRLPGWRGRVSTLRTRTAGPWAVGTPQYQVASRVMQLERNQSTVEGRGAGLVGEVKNFLSRASAGARGAQGMGALFALPPLAALLLVTGVGAIAAVLAAKLVDWLTLAESHEQQIGLAEKLTEQIRQGQISATEAAKILEAIRPPAGMFADLKASAGLIAVGAALVFLLPEFLKGRR